MTCRALNRSKSRCRAKHNGSNEEKHSGAKQCDWVWEFHGRRNSNPLRNVHHNGSTFRSRGLKYCQRPSSEIGGTPARINNPGPANRPTRADTACEQLRQLARHVCCVPCNHHFLCMMLNQREGNRAARAASISNNEHWTAKFAFLKI